MIPFIFFLEFIAGVVITIVGLFTMVRGVFLMAEWFIDGWWFGCPDRRRPPLWSGALMALCGWLAMAGALHVMATMPGLVKP